MLNMLALDPNWVVEMLMSEDMSFPCMLQLIVKGGSPSFTAQNIWALLPWFTVSLPNENGTILGRAERENCY